jgi:hypothetical protein
MSIPLTGSGGLFTRLGKIAGLLRAVNLFRGTGALLVTTLTGNGTTATATTLRAHGYTTGDTVTITGAANSGFNVSSVTITVTSSTQFTFANSTNATDTAKNIKAVKTSGAGFFGVGPYVDNLFAQFGSADQNLVDSLYSTRDAYRTVHSGLTSYLQTLAQNVLVGMANDDTPLSTQTVTAALNLLVSQMTGNAQSVQKPNVTASVTSGTNSGNAVCVASVLGGNGLQLDYAISEKVTVTVTADSQSGGATQYLETLQALGAQAESDPLNWDWPLGSGATASLTALDASVNASTSNLLTNSNFETFTVANTPDNWSIATGTAGTTVFSASSGNAYRDSSALQITGNGSELTSLTQAFNAAAGQGTSATLSPLTVYALNAFVKVSAVPAAGVLEISLIDGTGTIINDAQGNQNKVTLTLSGASTSYAALNAFFRTPAVIPSTYKLRVRLSTALDSGKSVFVDDLVLAPATQLYAGGPFVAVFSGNSKLILNDSFTVTVTNDYTSQWALMLDRLYSLRSLGLAVPSAGTPTVADSLIG